MGKDLLLPLKSAIPEQTLKRIPLYHQILVEQETKQEKFVSSKFLANFFRVDDTQVRKDVSIIGYKGKPKSGYSVSGLKQAIEEFLGINYENNAIIVGAGKLGAALAEYSGITGYGVKLVGIFDCASAKIGKNIGRFTVAPVESMPAEIKRYNVGIAVLTVPKQAAQAVCDTAVSCGIRAIWNFAPLLLSVPPMIIVKNENLAVSLAILSHHLKTKFS